MSVEGRGENQFSESQYQNHFCFIFIPLFKDVQSHDFFSPVFIKWSRMCWVSHGKLKVRKCTLEGSCGFLEVHLNQALGRFYMLPLAVFGLGLSTFEQNLFLLVLCLRCCGFVALRDRM